MYAKRTAKWCEDSGWRCVVFNYWRLDWADTRDMEAVVEHLERCHPRAPILGIAFSAGAHLLLRYLQRVGKRTPLVGAIAVSGCVDFSRVYDSLSGSAGEASVSGSASPLYRGFMDSCMRSCLRRHVSVAPYPDWQLADACAAAPLIYDRHLSLMPSFIGIGADTPTDSRQRGSFAFRSAVTGGHSAEVARTKMDTMNVTTLILHADDGTERRAGGLGRLVG